jgi:hypothetical protein
LARDQARSGIGEGVGFREDRSYQIGMADDLKGVTAEQRQELQTMLQRLGALWAELTKAAADQDEVRVAEIQREIATCRKRVEEIKRAGTIGSA